MDRILRSCMQVGGVPEAEDAFANWQKLQDNDLEFANENGQIYEYLKTFYNSMSAPPDFGLVKEYFEKRDSIDVVTRLEEIKGSQFYIRTNFLSIVHSEREQQQIRAVVLACRDASNIAEIGKNLDKPINGKKVLRGPADAVGYLFDRMADLTQAEAGEKLEGDITEDSDEVVEEYDVVARSNKFAGRNLFGLEPVDTACAGHRTGELWIHTASTGELKCIPGDSLLYNHRTKRRQSVKDIFESGKLPMVTSIYREGEQNRLVTTDASHVVENGIRPVYEMVLASGRRVSATRNHGFLTLNGWKKLGNIKTGEYVAIPKRTDISAVNNDYSDSEVKVAGYLLGDGYIGGKSGIVFTASNKAIREDFMSCLESIGMRNGKYDGKTPNFFEEFAKNRAPGVRISRSKGAGNDHFVSPVQELIECLGIHGKVASTKRIPEEFFFLPDSQVKLLLGALWSTDGSFHGGNHVRYDRINAISRRSDIRYHSTSHGLCLDVQSILLRLGINSHVTCCVIQYNGKPYNVYATNVVGSRNKKKFVESVNVIGKEMARQNVLDRIPNTDDRYPMGVLKRYLNDGHKLYFTYDDNGVRKYLNKHRLTISGSVLNKIAVKHKELLSHTNGGIRWEAVKTITYKRKEMTYDISVPEHKSFVVNDVVSHNTTLALNYLYNNTFLYNKNIFYCILEMPYKQLRRQIYVIHSSHGKFVTDWYAEDKKRGIPEEDRYRGLSYRRVRDGDLNEIDYKRLQLVAQDFKANRKGHPYVWRPQAGDYQKQPTIADIRRKAEMFHNKYGCDGIIIDHLALVRPQHRSNDYYTSLNSVVVDARQLALNFSRGKTVPVLGLFHLNRQGKLRADKSDGHYDLSAISSSNEVDKSADVITYTYLNDELRRQGKFYLGCLKNRDNAIFERMTGKIMWNSKRMRAMENSMLDPTNDQVLRTSNLITLTADDMLYSQKAKPQPQIIADSATSFFKKSGT